MPKMFALPKLRWSIAATLTLSMVLVIVLLMGLMTLVDIRRERALFHDGLEQRGLLLAGGLNDVLANYLSLSRIDELRDVAEVVVSQPEITYVGIYRPDGSLLVGGPHVAGRSEYPTGYATGQFGAGAIEGGQVLLRSQGETLEVASPIMSGSEVVGAVQFGFNSDTLKAEIRSIILWHIWQALILIAIGVALAYLTARFNSRYIRYLAAAANHIGQGHLESPVLAHGGRETSQLGNSLEHMRVELRQFYGGLEQRVTSRTEELSKTTEDLRAEVAERRRAQEAEQQLVQEIAVADEVARIITSTLDIGQVYERFAIEVKKLVEFDRAILTTIDHQNGTVRLEYVYAPGGASIPQGQVLPLKGTATGYMASARQPLIRGDLAESAPFWTWANYHREGLRSVVAVPLVSKEKVIGVFGLFSQRPHAYETQDQHILEHVARQIAPAIENARLYEQLKSNAEEMAVVDGVARIVTTTLEVERVYEEFAIEARKLLDFDAATINTVDHEAGEVTIQYTYGYNISNRPVGRPIRFENTVTGYVVETGLTLNREDIAGEGGRYYTDHALLQAGLRSAIRAPLTSQGKLIGTLGLFSRQIGAFGVREQAIVERLAAQIAPAIENANLYEQTKTAEAQARQLAAEKQLVAEVGRIISSTPDIDNVFERFAEQVRELVPFDRIVVNVVDPAHGSLSNLYVGGISVPYRQAGDEWPLAGTQLELVVRTASSLLVQVDDRDQLTGRFPGLLTNFDAGLRSFLSVPLKSENHVIGALNLRSMNSNAYSGADVAIAESVANQIAGAIANSQLYVERKRLAEENAVVAEIGRVITSSLDINAVYDRLGEVVQELIPFDRMSLSLIDQERATSSPTWVTGEDIPGRFPKDLVPLPGTVAGEVLLTKSAIMLEAEKDEDLSVRFPGLLPAIRAGLRSFLAVPLVDRNVVIGVLQIRSKDHMAYSQQHLDLAGRIGNQIAGAVANAQLYEQTKRAEEEARQLAAENQLVAEVGRIITSSLDIDGVYESFAGHLRQHIPFEWLGIALVDPGADTAVSSYVSGIPVTGTGPGYRVPLPGTLSERVYATRLSMIVCIESREDLAEEFPTLTPSFDAGIRTFMAVPLIAGDEVIGVLHVRSVAGNAYTGRDLELIEQVARQIAPAVENAQLYEQLKEGQERLRNLSSQLVEVQEAERRHVARELHDEVGQILTGLKLALEIVPKLPAPRARAKMQEATSLVNELMGLVRELSLDLRPAMLDDLGLLPALLWHFERFTARTQVKVACEHTGLDRRFPAQVETAAYRIVQEALTNVARHAGVGEVAVRVISNGSVLSLHVWDKGAGFDAGAVLANNHSNGLAGMRERATLLGGRLTVDTSPGAGVHLIAELPISEPNGKGELGEAYDYHTACG